MVTFGGEKRKLVVRTKAFKRQARFMYLAPTPREFTHELRVSHFEGLASAQKFCDHKAARS
jgi:hypothetical protein